MGLIEKMFLDPPLFFFGVLVWVEKRFEVLWQLKTCFLNPLYFFGVLVWKYGDECLNNMFFKIIQRYPFNGKPPGLNVYVCCF